MELAAATAGAWPVVAAIGAGVVAGALAALPLVVALRRPPTCVVPGVAAAAASLALLHLAAAAARVVARPQLVAFGATEALAFLVVVLAAALRRP